MSDEYIKRSDVLELAREYYTPILREKAVPVKAIKNIPAADVRPVRYGKWEKHGWSIRCSECGHDMPFATRNFCPNCGADMREANDEI